VPQQAAALIIYLGQGSRQGSINLPIPTSNRSYQGASNSAFGTYLVFQLLRFTQLRRHRTYWCALTAPFHPYLV